MLCSTNVFAGGKLIVQNNYFPESREYKPSVGLAVYQKIPFIPVALNTYAGYGEESFEGKEPVKWSVLKGSLDVRVNDFLTIAPGAQITKGTEWNTKYFVKAEMKLW